MTPRNKFGAWLMILTCPCHVAMLVFVLGGTAIGGVLAAFKAWVFLAFSLAFLLGLWLMVRKHVPDCDTESCGLKYRKQSPSSAPSAG